MKDTTIAIVILLLAFAADASPGQTPAPGTVAVNSEAANVLEPEFEGVFFRLVAGSLVPLERQPVPVTRSIIANAIAGAYSVAGGRSPVRFPANVPIEFVVRAPSATADPTNVYHLRKLAGKKNKREATTTFVPLQFARYGSSSYKVSTTGLPPGEYAIRRQGAQSAFCFGVD